MWYRTVKPWLTVLLVLSQVVATTPLHANSSHFGAKCCCTEKSPSNSCCCHHQEAPASKSCCHSAKAERSKASSANHGCQSICGCGCQQTTQQKAPLSSSSDPDELVQRSTEFTGEQIVDEAVNAGIPTRPEALERHTFFFELPQELLFCSWLI
ncbi:MAG: hypothetical protein HUJ26_14950 [Planctomycetaceae bacterium]|nr:hypothetical protein [Planctomycetaceae bacterium]